MAAALSGADSASVTCASVAVERIAARNNPAYFVIRDPYSPRGSSAAKIVVICRPPSSLRVGQMVDVVGVMFTLPGGERCITEPTVYALIDRYGDPCTWSPIDWLLPEPQRQVLSFPTGAIPPSDPSLTVGGARLDGFTIRNGRHGVYLTSASPAIANNIIEDNSGAASGGGIYCSGGAPLIWSNTIQENSATGGWMASGLGGGLYFDGSSPVVADNTIVDNSASSIEGSGYGGGIYCTGAGQPVFSGNTITGNSATTGGGICCSNSDATISYNNVSESVDGGGVYCEGDYDVELAGNSVSSNPDYGVYSHNCSAALTNNTISDNTGVGLKCDGTSSSPAISGNTVTNNALGGIVVDGVAEATIQNNVVESNSGRDEGAGIAIKDSAATITANTIKNNVASREGGAIMIDNSSVAIERNWIEGNCSTSPMGACHGGGIALHSGIDVTIRSNVFLRNHTDGDDVVRVGGGAIHAKDTPVIIANNTFVENYVGTVQEGYVWPAGYTPVAYGGAIHVRWPDTTPQAVTVLNNVFSANRASRGNSLACTESGVADISYCDAWPASGASYHYYDSSNPPTFLPTGLDTLTCTYLDPTFCGSGIYWLESNSPLRDIGQNPAVPNLDKDGRPRPGQDNLTDLGAYEDNPDCP